MSGRYDWEQEDKAIGEWLRLQSLPDDGEELEPVASGDYEESGPPEGYPDSVSPEPSSEIDYDKEVHPWDRRPSR